ncbi:hypothetical protein HOF46_03310, partial [Candidatus Woesearchaeota archaeon]|nr:hypothetical protein [Candidatus Woesearchaeota archaeon]
ADRVKGVARLRRGPKHKLHTYHFSMDDVLGTSSQEEAYFVEFTLRAYLPDDHQRSAFARLIIVGEENLIKDVVQYVKEHPADYLRFAKELVPQDQFPNVNKGILDKTPLGDEIVFLDTANMDKKINVHLNSDGDPIISYGISDNSSNLIEHVYAQYGEHVKVPKASKDRFSITKYK